jgi:predicted nucleic acid-binding protein
MFTGRLVFSQVMYFMPLPVFRRCVAKYQGDFKVRVEASAVLYWDTSALLSCFFADSHSATARKRLEPDAVHLLSSLAHAEACTVIARMTREGAIAETMAETIRNAITNGRWRQLNGPPDHGVVAALSRKWPLRGAHLWHLALAVSLQEELPELRLLSFDDRLREAAAGEGLTDPSPLATFLHGNAEKS